MHKSLRNLNILIINVLEKVITMILAMRVAKAGILYVVTAVPPVSILVASCDPPLEERDIPTGQWLCRECRGKDAEKPTSTRSSRAQSPVDVAPFEETEKKTRSQRNNSNTSQQTSENRKEEIRDLDRLQGNIDEIINDDAKSALDVLVKAARILNPRQFELPREIGVPFGFPGTEKG